MVAYAWDLEMPENTKKQTLLEYVRRVLPSALKTAPGLKLPQQPSPQIRRLYNELLRRIIPSPTHVNENGAV